MSFRDFARQRGVLPEEEQQTQQAPAVQPQQQAPTPAAQADAPAQPAQAGGIMDTIGRVARDLGIGLTETPQAVARGAMRAGNETSDTAFSAARWMNENVADLGSVGFGREPGKGFSIRWQKGMPDQNAVKVDSLLPPEPTTTTGNIVEGVAQFATGYALAGRFLRGFGIAAPVSGVGKAAEAITREGIAGAVAFDPHEERLSNLVQSFPALQNPVNAYLAASPDDSEAEGRFKSALENIALAAPVEALMHALKGVKAARAGDFNAAGAEAKSADEAINGWRIRERESLTITATERSKVTEGQTNELTATLKEKLTQTDTNRVRENFTETQKDTVEASVKQTDTNTHSETYTKTTRGDPRFDAQDTVQVDRPDGTTAREPYTSNIDITEDDAKKLVLAYSHGATAAVDDVTAASVFKKNLERVDNTEDAKRLFQTFAAANLDAYEKARGRSITLDDVLDQAKQVEDIFGVNHKLLVQSAGADLSDIRELWKRTAMYRGAAEHLHNLAANQANAVLDAMRPGFTGNKDEMLRQFLKTARLLSDIDPLVEGIKSEGGRFLSSLRAKVGPGQVDVVGRSDGLIGGPSGSTEGATAGGRGSTTERFTTKDTNKSTSEARARATSENTQSYTRDETNTSSTAYTREEQLKLKQENWVEIDEKFVLKLAYKYSRTLEPKAARKVVADAFGPGLMDIHNEYFINAILSGPKTHIVNMTTGLFRTALMVPGEKAIAGLINGATTSGTGLFGRDWGMFREAGDQYVGMMIGLKDSFKAAYAALKADRALLDPSNMTTETRTAISADGLATRSQAMGGTGQTFTGTPIGDLVNGLGNLIRLPSRLLTTEDELLKQINYRGRAYSLAMREGRSRGLEGDALGDFVGAAMNNAYDNAGRATNTDALQYAREVTYTQDLEYGISKKLQQAANHHPGLRVIVPFVRTPANIMRDAWQHTPMINFVQRQFREDMAAGGERRATALSKLAVGGAMWATAIDMAMSDDIIGGGPTDPRLRKDWLADGKLPYSVRRTDENGKEYYVSFNRADPYGMFFGIAADFAYVSQHLKSNEIEDYAVAATTSLAKMLSSKSYLQGIVNATQVFADPDRRGEAAFRAHMASYIPSIQNNFKGDEDFLREPRTALDAMMARTPGFGKVDLRRNALGEPMHAPGAWGPDWLSPVGVSRKTDDPVMIELTRLSETHQQALGTPAPLLGGANGIDLREHKAPNGYSAYDRYQELVGEIKRGGKTLRERLAEMIGSDAYKTQWTDGDFAFSGSRLKRVETVINEYREAARGQLGKEIPFIAMTLREQQLKEMQVLRFGIQPQPQ